VTAIGALHEDEAVSLENASQPPPRNRRNPRHPTRPCQQAILLIVRSRIALDSLWFKPQRSHVHKRVIFFINRDNEIDFATARRQTDFYRSLMLALEAIMRRQFLAARDDNARVTGTSANVSEQSEAPF
jgi:hypothetical protein